MKLRAFLFVFAMSTGSLAEPVKVIDADRITVGDVVEGGDEAIRKLDLGPAAPPGGSRLVSGRDVQNRLKSAGVTAKLKVPVSVRVVSAHRVLEPMELREMSRPLIEAQLRAGTELVDVKPPLAVTVRPSTRLLAVDVPQIPRRGGQQKATVLLLLGRGERTEHRIPVTIEVRMSDAAAAPEVAKGTVVKAIVRAGSVSVSASAQLVDGGDIGQEVRVTIRTTGKLVRAKIVSKTEVEVIGQ